jgi:cation diffusion facilitator family transporter
MALFLLGKGRMLMLVHDTPHYLPDTTQQITDAVRYAQLRRTLVLVLWLNYLVCVLKLGAGIWARSSSMIADGFHSLADGSSNVLALIGIHVAAKPADSCHPYGHSKYETLAAMGIAVLLLFIAWEVMRATWMRFWHPVAITVGCAQFCSMMVTMVINGLVSRYERKRGRQLASEVLIADAAHTGSDLYISSAVVFSLIATRLGYPQMDLLASVVIIILIVRTAVEIIISNSRVLCDTAVLDPHEVREVAQSIDGVTGCHAIRTRGRDSELYLDMHIEVAGCMDIAKAHDLSHRVAKALCQRFNHLTEALIHVEPSPGSMDVSGV